MARAVSPRYHHPRPVSSRDPEDLGAGAPELEGGGKGGSRPPCPPSGGARGGKSALSPQCYRQSNMTSNTHIFGSIKAMGHLKIYSESSESWLYNGVQLDTIYIVFLV